MSTITEEAPVKREVSESHKAALARGRELSRIVKAYLVAIDQNRPRRGRKVTVESLHRRVSVIDTAMVTADPFEKLGLIQTKMDVLERIEELKNSVDIAPLEEEFVSVAKEFSDSKGYTYAAWREVGVTPSVLTKAGISR